MRYFIVFNNKKSSDFNLKIANRPNISAPIKDVEVIDIPGGESVILDNGRYKNLEINVEFNFIEYKNYILLTRKIKDWLINIINNTLRLSDDNEAYYKVLKVEFDDIERSIRVLGNLKIKFICEPFAYLNKNFPIVIDKIDGKAGVKFLAPAFCMKSKPFITIIGNGNGRLSINEYVLEIKDINKFIKIDVSKYEASEDAYSIVNYKVQGEYPTLHGGENFISFDGDIDEVEIIPNWRIV